MPSIRGETAPSSLPPAPHPQPARLMKPGQIITPTNRRRRLALISLDLLRFLNLGGHGDRSAVRHQDEQSGRSAKGPAGDAVLAGPTAVFVLSARDSCGHLPVPFFPFLTAFNYHS